MKRRVRKIANFFAFNLLFFALYLNFIHKDKVVFSTEQATSAAPASANAAFSETVLVKNPEKYTEQGKTVSATPASGQAE